MASTSFFPASSSAFCNRHMMMADHLLFPPLRVSALLIFFLICNTNVPWSASGQYQGSHDQGHAAAAQRLQTYIVHLQQPHGATAMADAEERNSWYESFVPSAAMEARWVHSYHEVLSGFAARLTEEELSALEKKEGFLHAYPDTIVPLATTHSPDFLGLRVGSGLWGGAASGVGMGEGVIVGMVDGGFTPGHPSFDGDGMPPPPPVWKGYCEPPELCNNKIIGARSFVTGGDGAAKGAPTDEIGHGTHTASTAAGAFVKGASVLGSANGTAAGMAPRAHLAIYKACTGGCQLSDILAAMDAAVADGVDVISLSLSGSEPVPFYSDGIGIAAFGAVRRGVFVSCAGSNYGPEEGTVTNEAPWILTVAASTMDRSIVASVGLGDGQEFEGQSAFQPRGFPRDPFPLVYPAKNATPFYCDPDSMKGADVKGKIVLCDIWGDIAPTDKGAEVFKAGGVAIILANEEADGYTTESSAHVLPASHVSFAAGSRIKDYIKASKRPTASIHFEGTKLRSSPVPAVAAFSSRGPSTYSTDVLKPDIAGPGVSVLAAWPSPVGPPEASGGAGGATTHFNMISGTSMATPHLSGVAALLKNAHPDWSPAVIKSAIMTTSDVRGNDGEPIKDEQLAPASFFAMGAGHVNATRAADPGLVYDLGAGDYIAYICGLGYTDEQVAAIVGRRGACSPVVSISGGELNYPSIAVTLSSSKATVSVNRTATNVGEARETYTVQVEQPAGVKVSVSPQVLRFSAVKEKQSFTVSFTPQGGKAEGFLEGSLLWVSEKHVVRNPISIAMM